MLWLLHQTWQRNHVPPWDYFQVRWHPWAKSAWYLASTQVQLESEQAESAEMVRLRQRVEAAEKARQQGQTPAVLPLPTIRRAKR